MYGVTTAICRKILFKMGSGSVWNCLWGLALQISHGINHKSRASNPGPRFLSNAAWPLMSEKL